MTISSLLKRSYEALQFNFVVSTKQAPVSLSQKQGFSIVGTLPRVFHHQKLGYEDAYVMHRFPNPALALSVH